MKLSLPHVLPLAASLIISFSAAAHLADEPGLPSSAVIAAMPQSSLEIAALAIAKPGEKIVIRGRIPMSKDAFNADGSFVLVDDVAAAECCPKDGTLLDSCKLDASKKIIVKLVDSAGKPLTGSLQNKNGLKAGAEVFVSGSLDPAAPSTILASGIHVPAVSLPMGTLVAAAPADAKDVAAQKKVHLEKGDRVTIRGVIGGSKAPFVQGRAMFTLMSTSLKPCNANPEDKCPVPWDYCCETKAHITANAATIRLVDSKGNLLKTDLKGRAGIRELSELIISGKVFTAEKGALVIDAESLHIVKR